VEETLWQHSLPCDARDERDEQWHLPKSLSVLPALETHPYLNMANFLSRPDNLAIHPFFRICLPRESNPKHIMFPGLSFTFLRKPH